WLLLYFAMEQLKKLKTSSDESSSSSSSSWGHNISFKREKMVDVKEEPVSWQKERRYVEISSRNIFLSSVMHLSDKASILIDTKQILKDLMTQVDRLKAEYVTLSQESLLRGMVPWMPHYTYPLPVVAITQGPVSTLPFPLNGTQTPAPLPN
ncbi:hypothetical protein HID58_040194, partial [Brassica napus]